jgi:hypothetical protein
MPYLGQSLFGLWLRRSRVRAASVTNIHKPGRNMTIHYESFSLQVSDFSVLVQGPNQTDNEINSSVRVARRLSTIGLSKPNTWGSGKPPIHRWEYLTPLRYKLRAVSISSMGFLLIEDMQCSADLHTGTDAAAGRAASRDVIGIRIPSRRLQGVQAPRYA